MPLHVSRSLLLRGGESSCATAAISRLATGLARMRKRDRLRLSLRGSIDVVGNMVARLSTPLFGSPAPSPSIFAHAISSALFKLLSFSACFNLFLVCLSLFFFYFIFYYCILSEIKG